MARKKRKTDRELRTRLGVLSVILAVMFILAFQAVRYLGTTPGEIFLLDAGLGGKFRSVQREIGEEIIGALSLRGVRREDLDIRAVGEAGGGQIYVIKAKVPGESSLVRINDAIDRSVESVGGRVRSCREGPSGDSIRMEIGTRTRVTHRCYIRRSSQVRPARMKGPAVAIVVDDFGFFKNSLVSDFMGLNIKLTVSVIPGLKYSPDICRMAADSGKDAICHMPMEPENSGGDYGGMHLVTVSMDEQKIEEVVEGALKSTPGVVGMNNHMGSRATADSRVMQAVIGVCRKHDIFFFDSLTSSKSVASEVARSMGMAGLSNDLFLDNRGDDIRERMDRLMEIASRRGYAMGIMHVRRDSLQGLKWMIEAAGKRGIRFVTLREIADMVKIS